MRNCKNCGEEISDQQYQNYNGLCPACKRIKGARQYGQNVANKSFLCMGFVLGLSLLLVPSFFGLFTKPFGPVVIIFNGMFVIGAIVLVITIIATIIYLIKRR